MEDIFIAKYDSSGNVIWAKKAGGTGKDVSRSIVIDSYGNCYITGTFSSATASFGSITINNTGLRDIFLARYNAINGDEEFVKNFGSNDDDGATKLVVDEAANCYFIGDFHNTVVFSGSISLTSVGAFDSFIAKSDSSFNVVWAKRAGGSGSEVAYDIRFKNGFCYATGYFQNTVAFGSLPSISSAGNNDVFIVKYEASLGIEKWAKNAGGSGVDMAFAIDIDITGNIIISGFFQSTAVFGSLPSITSQGSNDIFIAKYDTLNGNAIWAKRAGGSGNDYGNDIDTDCQGNIYVVSTFEGSANFGGTTINSAGSSDVSIAKYDPLGNIIWVEKAGGTGIDDGIGIGLDKDNYCYVSGKFSSTANFGSLTPVSSAGNSDIFLVKLSPTTTCCAIDVDLGNDTILCIGQSLILDAGNPGATYLWSTGAASQTINVVSGNSYWVDVKDICTGRDSIEVVFLSPLTIDLGEDTTLCAGQTLQFNFSNNATYQWSTGSSSLGLTIDASGQYWVNVFQSPCPMVTDSIEIFYIPSIDYMVYNLITCNKDGKNDVFQISGLIPNTTLSVYNRWGDLIYKNENYLNDWKPEDINEGIYFYHISNKNTCVKEYKGWTHVVK